MTITAIISLLILLGITLVMIGTPFLQKQRRDALEEQKAMDELVTAYERVLATIRDLDEDYNTGKLDAETYNVEREYWAERGVLLLQEIEPDAAADPMIATTQKAQTSPDSVLDDAIENAILAYRQAKGATV